MTNVPAKFSAPSTPVCAPKLLHGLQSLSPYVDVKGADDFPTPPPSPPPDDKKRALSDSTPIICKRTKTTGLPTEFLTYFGDAVAKSTALTDAAKRSLLGNIVGELLDRRQTAAGLSSNGRLSSGHVSSGSYYKNHAYAGAYGVDCTFSTATNNFASAATNFITTLEVGTQPGQLAQGAQLAKFSKISFRMNLWPDCTAMTSFVGTNPASLAKLNSIQYRVMVIRDKFGSIGGSPTLYEVPGSAGAPPDNFDCVLFNPSSSSTPNLALFTNTIMSLQYSDLTCPARFEILHDTLHTVARPVFIGSSSTPGSASYWTGQKHHQFEVHFKDGLQCVYDPNVSNGSFNTAQVNQVIMIVFANINTAASALTYLPVPRADIFLDAVFEEVLPAET